MSFQHSQTSPSVVKLLFFEHSQTSPSVVKLLFFKHIQTLTSVVKLFRMHTQQVSSNCSKCTFSRCREIVQNAYPDINKHPQTSTCVLRLFKKHTQQPPSNCSKSLSRYHQETSDITCCLIVQEALSDISKCCQIVHNAYSDINKHPRNSRFVKLFQNLIQTLILASVVK